MDFLNFVEDIRFDQIYFNIFFQLIYIVNSTLPLISFK